MEEENNKNKTKKEISNKKAIIASHRIECPQLRIANILKEIEKEEIEETKQFASVDNDVIILK